MARILDVKGLNGGYGSVQILYDIDLDDMSPYSLIIDADSIGADEVLSIVRSKIRK